jgi:flavin-binding monooxygenase-like protein
MALDRPLSVCVIGAGVSGLAISKQLRQRAIPFHTYDRRERVGGIWAYDERPGTTSVWHTLNMNTPRGRYQFKDFPMPRSYADFPRHSEVQEYLSNYVDRFAFRDALRLQTGVSRVSPAPGSGWEVELDSGEALRYDAVVIANGHHNAPLRPEFPGCFSGRTLHSQDYRHREAFGDRRVLVVGFGNSGSQIAVDVSGAAQQTFLSIRRGGYLLPHYLRGKTIDFWFNDLLYKAVVRVLPWPLAGAIFTAAYRLLLGKPERFGLPKPDHHFGAALPTFSENLINRIGDGRLRIKPSVQRLDGNEVVFADDSRETIDDIIECTGYRITFPFLDRSIFEATDNRVRLFLRTFHPQRQSLAFIGAFQAIAWGFLPLFEAQSELAASYLAGEYALPSAQEMEHRLERDLARSARRFVSSTRNHYQLDGARFLRECATELERGRRRARMNGR